MQLNRSIVKLYHINVGDEFFRYSDERYDTEALIRSISYSGILNPVILLEDKNGYRIVTGFRRINTAIELGINEIQANIVGSNAKDEELFKLSILENQSTRTLNLYEKATLLSKLKDTGISQEKIVKLFMPLINLPPSLKHMQEVLLITELPAQLVDYIVKKNFSVRKFRHLKDYSEQSLAFMIDFVDYLNPGANLFVEISKRLAGAAARDDKKLDEVIDSWGLNQLIKDKEIEKDRKIIELRERVFDLRYPVLSGENRKIKQKLRLINKRHNQDIDWDRSLEKSGLQIKLRLNRQEDLKTSMMLLKEIEANRVLEDLFD